MSLKVEKIDLNMVMTKITQILDEISVLIHVNRLKGPGGEPLVCCKVMCCNTEIYLERIKSRNLEQESTYSK